MAYCWDGIARALVKEEASGLFLSEGGRKRLDRWPRHDQGRSSSQRSGAFINYVCGQPKAGVEVAKQFYYAPANQSAMAALDDETKAILRVADLDKLLGGGQLQLNRFETADFKKIGDWWSDIHSSIQ